MMCMLMSKEVLRIDELFNFAILLYNKCASEDQRKITWPSTVVIVE